MNYRQKCFIAPIYVVACLVSSLMYKTPLHAELPSIMSRFPLQCDWSTINVNDVHFPAHFRWGAATSACQIEGSQIDDGKHVDNTWTTPHAKRTFNLDPIACDHWNQWKEDVQLIKQAHLHEYRFSIKWSAVQPQADQFDAQATQHYVNLVQEIIRNDITPYVTLFHHAWPTWFEELGAFEKAENIAHFIRFARHVFTTLQSSLCSQDFARIKWMTFNEPVGYALQGYFRGHYPPYKKDLKLAGKVVQHMLDAHTRTYYLFKKLAPATNPQIGFAHIVTPLDPARAWHPLERMICAIFGHINNDAILSYFKEGSFTWGAPCYGRFTAKNKKAVGALDFLAINYYSNTTIEFQHFPPKVKITGVQGKPMTGPGKCMYPEGLYRSVVNVAQQLPNVPLLIGENGVCTTDETLRETYMKQHLYAVHQLIQDGYPVYGYHVWALFDTWSWNNGTLSPYGIYEINHEKYGDYRRVLRDGYKNILNLFQHGRYTKEETYADTPSTDVYALLFS